MNTAEPLAPRTIFLGAIAAFLAALIWAYAAVLEGLLSKWGSDPQYSHGYLVPLFAIGLLWMRRDDLVTARLRPSLWGLPVLAAALLFRQVSSHLYFEWFEQLSLVACLPGLLLLAGGVEALRWAWPACLFLLFMLPLPYSLEVALRDPLRQIGTTASTYVMQTAGLPAYAEGKVIVIDDVRIGVVEACSGLRMLMIFFALATAVAMVSGRPLWQRVLLILSAVPIALIANILRITATAILHTLGYREFAELVFHDLAGWLMMPLALGLLWVGGMILDRLVVTETEAPTSVVPSPSSTMRVQENVTTEATRAKRRAPNGPTEVERVVGPGLASR